ncbi:MAG: reverse gyrase [Candidatus Aenigmatarchaeota archaeon]
MVRTIFYSGCLNCNGEITDEELIATGKCSKCLNKETYFEKIKKEFNELENFFSKILGYKPTKIQKSWLSKFSKGKSFALIAPTGCGKTTFGILVSIFYALNNKKSYIILPTSVLVNHVYEKTIDILKRNNIDVKVACYSSQLSEKAKKENLEKIKANDFSILITSDRFLKRLENIYFDLIFIDDLDNFLKNSKNVEKVWNIRKENGIIIVSGATLKGLKRSRGYRMLKERMGFEFSFRPEFIRNIDDYITYDANIVDLIKKIGSGGLIFVPMSKGSDFGKEVENKLKENGINALFLDSKKKNILKKFENGEIDVLIGIGSYRSPLARGIDLPLRIRYAIFYGVPRIEIRLNYENSPPKMILLLRNILPFLEDNYQKAKVQYFIDKLSSIYTKFLYEGYIDEKLMNEVNNFLSSIINKEFIEKIEKTEFASIIRKNEDFYLFVSDPLAYIQGSGRTSRLFVGGISKGLSILIIDDKKAFNDLKKKISIFIDDLEFKEIDEKSLIETIKKVDEDREKIKRKEEIVVEYFDSALIIVESPTKARTISRFFGIPAKRIINGINVFESIIGKYLVSIVATQGHLFELKNEGGLYGVRIFENKFIPAFDYIKKCNKCNETFVDGLTCPYCNSNDVFNKKVIMDVLKDLALEHDKIFIATDFDAEGEKICFDIYTNLKTINENIKRLAIKEITRKALLQAIESPLELNEKLVESQLVRRIEDRFVGYSLSEVLQKEFNRKTLSAGRVQSPLLKWVVENAKEYSKKKKILTIKAENGLEVSFEIKEKRFDIGNKFVEIDENEIDETIKPLPPYTTDSFLKDASSILKLSSNEAMRIAQDLFESGLITYIRTDSTTVSDVGIRIAEEYLKKKNLSSIFEPKKFFKEGAHECIRPTRSIDGFELEQLINLKLMRLPIKLTRQHFSVYDLIFKRFIASQCKSGMIVKQIIKASLNGYSQILERIVDVKDEGFLKFSYIKKQERIEKGKYKIVEASIKKIPSAWLYREGDLIERMKNEGIGRPSTYSAIIAKLFERGYVIKIKERIIPTKLGKQVIKFLEEKYPSLISVETTRKLEENMDEIEKGNLYYQDVIAGIFNELKGLKLIYP